MTAFICLHTQQSRYGFARSEYSYSQGHSGKLQIVDLLYLGQLNQSILLFNSIALQFFLMFAIFTLLEQLRKIEE